MQINDKTQTSADLLRLALTDDEIIWQHWKEAMDADEQLRQAGKIPPARMEEL